MPTSRPTPSRPRTVAPAKARARRRAGALSRIRIILSTAPASAANRIARTLVGARVAACVNVLPGLVSTYRWHGRIERAREVLLVIKTTGGCAARCRRALERVHPYDVPEVVTLRPEQVSPAYARWVEASTRTAST